MKSLVRRVRNNVAMQVGGRDFVFGYFKFNAYAWIFIKNFNLVVYSHVEKNLLTLNFIYFYLLFLTFFLTCGQATNQDKHKS